MTKLKLLPALFDRILSQITLTTVPHMLVYASPNYVKYPDTNDGAEYPVGKKNHLNTDIDHTIEYFEKNNFSKKLNGHALAQQHL